MRYLGALARLAIVAMTENVLPAFVLDFIEVEIVARTA
jgi:hypothetical protein